MYEQVERPKENKSRAVANSVSQRKSSGKQCLGFVDNRQKMIPQGKLLQRQQVCDKGEVRRVAPIQRLEIANIASGTDPSTLMHSQAKDHKVINIDTGHMVISDAIIGVNNPRIWKVIADEFFRLGLSTSVPGARKLGSQTKEEWLAAQMSGNISVGAARLKQVLGAKPGMKGAYEIYHLLPDPLKYEIAMKLQSLDDFKLGDLGTFADQSVKKGGTDVVYIVNALGFDPLGDPVQARHLATGIKPGGLLIITAEASGQSVQSLIPKSLTRESDADTQIQAFLRTAAGKVLGRLPLGVFFNLTRFVVGSKATAMSSDQYTSKLDTRHTITSGASTSMEDNIPTVQLILVRNDKPVGE